MLYLKPTLYKCITDPMPNARYVKAERSSRDPLGNRIYWQQVGTKVGRPGVYRTIGPAFLDLVNAFEKVQEGA